MKELLRQGCKALGLDVTDEKLIQLIAYVQLLDKWNKVFNLTSIREPKKMISQHLLDSLSVTPYLSAGSLLDVGTGAGFPGVPLAIVKPEMVITLLDSNSKKTRFLQQVKAELALENITIINSRVEQAILPQFDFITARAFSTIDNIIDLTGRHCNDAGCLILMKGTYPEKEMPIVAGGFSLQDVISLDVPYCKGQRHLVRLAKNKLKAS